MFANVGDVPMKPFPSASAASQAGWAPRLPPMSLLDDVLESHVIFSEYFTWEPEGVLTLYK